MLYEATAAVVLSAFP